MGEFYFTGWLFALIIGFIKMVMGFSMLNSVRVSNLKKIGLHFSPLSGKFKNSPATAFQHIFYVIYLLVITPLFSWISVVSGVWPFIAMWTNKVDVPEKIKEIQFKLATTNLEKDEILSLIDELQKLSGQTSTKMAENFFVDLSEQIDTPDDDLYTLSIGDDEWPASFDIDPKSKRLDYNANTPDYDSIFKSILEYKFEEQEILIRTVEDSVNNYGKVTFNIKDNVVLTSEIRKQCNDNKFMDYDKQIEKYSKRVEWSQVELHKLKFFIMSHHP
tara:strand:- start:38 stop:859 length:822 start_codon:yes stop_codon:yes gene_type:complete